MAALDHLRPVTDSAAPVVSIVIPCYNQAHFLDDAIKSALGQTYRAVEVIVVNDGSTDDTETVARRCPEVRCLTQTNQGLAAARNTGIRASSGSFLVFLDADDRLLPDAVETNLSWLLDRHEWAFVSGEHRYIDRSGQILQQWSRPVISDNHYRRLLEGNYIGMCATVLYRRSTFDRFGGFDQRWNACEDYELYLRVTRRSTVGSHGYVIAEYRRYGQAMSDDPARMLRASISILRSQRGFVRTDHDLLDSYKKGLKWWRWYYGTPLISQVRRDLAHPSTRLSAIGAALTLARYSPGHIRQLAGER